LFSVLSDAAIACLIHSSMPARRAFAMPSDVPV
jgi:hypothetical protein